MATDKPRRAFKLPPPIKPLRSLRVKVLLVVSGVALAPLALVGLWSVHERSLENDLKLRVAYACDEVAENLAHARDRDAVSAAALSTARLHALRVRIVASTPASGENGDESVDANFDEGTDLLHKLGTVFFGPDGAPNLDVFDRGLEPLTSRAEIAEARARGTGTVTGCRVSAGSKLLVCHAARVVPAARDDRGDSVEHAERIVYVQESSRRAVRALYDVRYQLSRLSLATIPFALLLAYWMGKRVVSPLEALRAQALARATDLANPGAGAMTVLPLHVRGQDEITDLASAFDALVSKLTQRQGENERFVADLVHEFKNPVAAIRAAAEAMTDGPMTDARAQRLGKVLGDSSVRLDALVSQFLELARAEGGLTRDDRSRGRRRRARRWSRRRTACHVRARRLRRRRVRTRRRRLRDGRLAQPRFGGA